MNNPLQTDEINILTNSINSELHYLRQIYLDAEKVLDLIVGIAITIAASTIFTILINFIINVEKSTISININNIRILVLLFNVIWCGWFFFSNRSLQKKLVRHKKKVIDKVIPMIENADEEFLKGITSIVSSYNIRISAVLASIIIFVNIFVISLALFILSVLFLIFILLLYFAVPRIKSIKKLLINTVEVHYEKSHIKSLIFKITMLNPFLILIFLISLYCLYNLRTSILDYFEPIAIISILQLILIVLLMKNLDKSITKYYAGEKILDIKNLRNEILFNPQSTYDEYLEKLKNIDKKYLDYPMSG